METLALINPRPVTLTDRIPPHVFFLVSAVFHYLGPALAVLLFAQVSVLGVVWIRIASAALVFAIWRRPWCIFLAQSLEQRRTIVALGVVLGLMNASFYLAISRLPLSTVGAIEFIAPITLAAFGTRTMRNVAALALAAMGGWLLTSLRLEGEVLGYVFAFINCGLFMLYIVLGHRISRGEGASGIDRLGLAMLIALVVVSPIGFGDAIKAFQHPMLLLAGIGVGVCSSVIPYVCDQLAMARLSRPTFALLLALLPASATLIGVIVLHQTPTLTDIAGVALVAGSILIHREST